MANTYVKIASVTVGAGGAATISFTSISAGYTDLILKVSGRTNFASTVEGSSITFNGSNTYATRYLQGDGGSATSGTQTILNALLFNAATATASTFGNSEMYIPNYQSSANKSVSGDGVSENNATQAYAGLFAASATLTSAITSITITPNAGGSFIQYSTATLYGIKNS